jgi:ribosomal-protein-alanine N-acetyltransferase
MAHISAARLLRERESSLPRESARVQNPYRLRAATPADVKTLENLEREAFPTLEIMTPFRREVCKPGALYLVATRPLTPDEQRELRRQALEGGGPVGWARRLLNRLLFEKLGPGLGTAPGEHIAGVAGLWFVLDECHIVIIGSRLSERRRGIGELLLIGATEAALKRGMRVVTLEVRASNEAARSLYHKYGFQDAGVRKRYYSDNNEDAVIMTTPPIQSADYRKLFESLVRSHAERWGEAARALP